MLVALEKRQIPVWGKRLSPVLAMLISDYLWAVLVEMSCDVWTVRERSGLETEAEILVVNLDEGLREDIESKK